MSALKKQRSPGTLSSASLKRRFLRRKRRVAPGAQKDADSELCRCSIVPLSGCSRTVRRILTACTLSLLALFGSVSVDLSSNFDLLHATEAAYDELTSCRTITILHLVSKLQQIRHLLAKDMNNETLETSFAALDHPCGDVENHCDGRGLPCSTSGSCQETTGTIRELLNASLDANSRGLALTEAIQRLLTIWGSVEDSLVKAKQNSNWRDVLSARVLLTFIELNHQLMFSHLMVPPSGFQLRWTHTLSYLSFSRLMAERLDDCWLENVEVQMNSSLEAQDPRVFDMSRWQMSRTGSGLLSGSGPGLRVLTNTQRCLFSRASSALWLASRSLSSSLSVRICLLAVACLIYPVGMFSFKQMTEWIQNYAQSLKEKTEDLKRQRQLAEDLLHQMLPKSVAKQLRKHKHVEAESYEKVRWKKLGPSGRSSEVRD
ncbi:putative LOC107391376-like protein [Nothobranchius furzeri]|uniref:guanylate cyclase n=1 Tax=Nothobranchius furzeri TaxID=105023 RepID=A0A9D3BK82_NOTFU|nr:putative LOC107391376-like protein [Nothobranchius furzeri]